MGFLASVTKGKIKKPFILLVYGPSGVGKTTFGSQAPNPVFLGTEDGSNNIDTSRGAAPKDWAAVMEALKEIRDDPHDYKTLVIDSLDWLEPLVYARVCKDEGASSIEKVGGGYGKGYMEAMTLWLNFKDWLVQIRDKRQMNIILIGHSEPAKEFDAILQLEITRHQLKLYKKASALFREFAEAVLFCNFETAATVKDKKVLAISDGSRVAYTDRRHGHDAKNRFGLPLTIEVRWEAFVQGVEAGNPESVAAIMGRIDGLMSQVQDAKLKETVAKFVTDNKDNVGALLGAEAKLKTMTALK